MVEPDILVRAAGSFLLAPVGIAAIVLAKGDRGGLALGTFLASMGLYLGGQNIFTGNLAASTYWTPVALVLALVGTLAALGMVLWWPQPLRRREWPWAALALAFGIGVAIVTFALIRDVPLSVPVSDARLSTASFVLATAREAPRLALLLLLPIRFLLADAADPSLRRRAAWGAVLLVLTPLSMGSWIFDPLVGDNLLEAAVLLIGVPLWLAATRAPQGHLAARVAIVLAALGLVGLTFHALFHRPAVGNVLVGVERSVYAFLLAFGIARLGFAGRDIQLRTARRGTVAMAALAALFVVAQVAQEFLSAEYGLLMGGVVAGAFLFAASPLQRAMERMSGQASQGPERAQVSAARMRSEKAYLAALRVALNDGAMTEAEEHHLAEVAEHLGLGPMDALRLRKDVERERSAEVR